MQEAGRSKHAADGQRRGAESVPSSLLWRTMTEGTSGAPSDVPEGASGVEAGALGPERCIGLALAESACANGAEKVCELMSEPVILERLPAGSQLATAISVHFPLSPNEASEPLLHLKKNGSPSHWQRVQQDGTWAHLQRVCAGNKIRRKVDAESACISLPERFWLRLSGGQLCVPLADADFVAVVAPDWTEALVFFAPGVVC